MGPLGKERRWRSRRREVSTEAQVLQFKFASLRLLILVVFAVLSMQLFNMQVLQGDDYRLRAEHNRLREVSTMPSRGLIYDRNGMPLVENVPSFSAAAVPADLPKSEQSRILAELEQLLGVPSGEMAFLIEVSRDSQDPFSPVILKRDLSEETAFTLREMESRFPGVKVVAEPVRNYTTGSLLGGILGYVGEDLTCLRSQRLGQGAFRILVTAT
jgi:penicillin-binding protein 2